MSELKLISFRIEKDMLEIIEKIGQSQPYLSRSRVLHKFLSAMVFCTSENEMWEVLNTFDPYMDGIEIHVTRKKKQ